jgi:aspartoacylase
MNPKKVLIFGGTHGNEWTGVYVVKNYSHEIKNQFHLLNIEFIHANPKAFIENKRFVDEDLNRSFEFLGDIHHDSYEHGRAQEIKKLISKEECFLIDLHTTTSNMGNTLIISHHHPVNFLMAQSLKKKIPELRVILAPDPGQKYLVSQSQQGLIIEVGPVANGVVDAAALEATLKIIREILLQMSKPLTLPKGELEVFQEVEDIYYPQNKMGELLAYIHEDFQHKNFIELNGAYTPFKQFDGQDRPMMANRSLYPIFINEAAYYPRRLAYTLCERILLKL